MATVNQTAPNNKRQPTYTTMMKVMSLAATLALAHAQNVQIGGARPIGISTGGSVTVGGRPAPATAIPQDCVAYFDGCNRCGAQNGQITMCTEMACKQQLTPYCTRFADGTECADAQCAMAHAATSSQCTDDSQCAQGSFCRQSAAAQQWTLNRAPPMECHPYSTLGATCGGFVAPGYESRCSPELECVNTMGPMIMDAPGSCVAQCPALRPTTLGRPTMAGGMMTSVGAVSSISTVARSQRDAWGNCIDPNCQHWFDGCNVCTRDASGRSSCTEEFCYQPSGPAECRDQANTGVNQPNGQNGQAGGRDVCKTASGAPACRGPAPMSPSHICPDGTVAGPTCVATGNPSSCQWRIRECTNNDAVEAPPPQWNTNTYVDAAGNVVTTGVATAETGTALPADGSAPAACTTWFDGCNTCTRDRADGPLACTMMYCFTSGTPECRGWAAGSGH